MNPPSPLDHVKNLTRVINALLEQVGPANQEVYGMLAKQSIDALTVHLTPPPTKQSAPGV